MNEHLTFNNLNKREQVLVNLFLFAFSLTLPINENVNTWFLIGLIMVSVYITIKYNLKSFIGRNILLLLIPASLFLIRLIGISYSVDIEQGLKETQRSLSFIFIPFTFLVLSQFYNKKVESIIFKGLLIGCILAILVCWGNAISAVVRNNEPIVNLFGWKRSNVYLTKIIGIHPPYLGMLVLTSLLYLFKNYIHNKPKSINRSWGVIVSIILITFIFHLIARNSIFVLTLLFLGYVVYYRKWRYVILGIVLIVPLFYAILNEDSGYLKRKYYKMLDFSNEDLGDKRFSRLDASWEVFKKHPIIGPGIGNDDILRCEQYKTKGYNLALKERFNAHNQYFEYLSTFGLVGFTLFSFVLVYFFYKTIAIKNFFLFTLLIVFSMASLTESILERELGIKYLSLIVGIIIYNLNFKEKASK